MKRGRDAIACKLAVGVQKRCFHREKHVGAGHDLAFERVAVDVDHGGCEVFAAGVDFGRTLQRVADGSDRAVFDQHICFNNIIRQNDVCACDPDAHGMVFLFSLAAHAASRGTVTMTKMIRTMW